MLDSTLVEIYKHKNNISNLSTKVLKTLLIQDEIFLINEIKKETEILISLLNIKSNILNQNQHPIQNINNQIFMPIFNQKNLININNNINNNNNNNINNNQFPQMPQPQIPNAIQQQMMMQQMQLKMMQQLAQQEQIKNDLNNNNQNDINIQPQNKNEQFPYIIMNKTEEVPRESIIGEDLLNNRETTIYLDEINIIFKPIGDNEQPLEPVIVKCKPNDLVAYIIEQYRKQSGDKSRYKKFIFEEFNLFPGMTIANSGLYNNAEIYVYKNNE